jgi:hypothetical protein
MVKALVVGQHIRHIMLHFGRVTPDVGDACWGDLFVAEESAVSMKWQRNFPTLKRFKVLINTRPSSSCWQADLGTFRETLGR